MRVRVCVCVCVYESDWQSDKLGGRESEGQRERMRVYEREWEFKIPQYVYELGKYNV